jgi:hypothetical protein
LRDRRAARVLLQRSQRVKARVRRRGVHRASPCGDAAQDSIGAGACASGCTLALQPAI